MGTFVLRGLPDKLSRDSWWLISREPDESAIRLPPTNSDSGHADKSRRTLWLIALVAALALLADFLFWDRPVGLSLAVFALVLHGVLWFITRDEASRKSTGFHAAIAILSVLPAIELLQELSVLFLIGGLLINGTRVALGHETLGQGFARAMWRLGLAPFWLALRDFLRQGALMLEHKASETSYVPQLGNWGLTLIGGLVFIALFSSANPVLEGWLESLLSFQFDLPDGWRIAFWLFIAALVWPLAKIRQLYSLLAAPMNLNWSGTLPSVNASSITNALVVFNLLMLGQNLLDASILTGVTPLPEHVTSSQYVRRGAYTLIATAMLAGGFAIQSRPYADSRKLLGLLYFWVMQNVLLVLSGAFKLSLVIEEHGLSYMRLHGGVWMLVVLIGFGLIAWQIRTGHANSWLWRWNIAQVSAVLYLCCFVNFAHVITADQLARGNTSYYPWTMGPHSAAALKGRTDPKQRYWYNTHEALRLEGWRDWGFRDARVRAYLADDV